MRQFWQEETKTWARIRIKHQFMFTGVSQVIKFTCEVTDFKLGVHVCKSKHGSLHFINSMQLFLVTLKCTEVSTTFQVFVFK